MKITCKYRPQDLNGKNNLSIEVKDTGIGIKKSNQVKLFKLFGFNDELEKINTKGIGMGLHISKKITNLLGGDIYFVS